MTKLLVADDHPLFRTALIQSISASIQPLLAIESGCFDSTCQALAEHANVDLLLLDLQMPGSCGFFGLIELRKNNPTLPIVVISACDDLDVIRRIMTFGASGFIPKSAHPTEINQALQQVLQGEIWLPKRYLTLIGTEQQQDLDIAMQVTQLTSQQYKILYLLSHGWLNKQIAYDLHISEATVKAHLTAIFRKLGVSNRTQAVIQTQRLQLEAPIFSE